MCVCLCLCVYFVITLCPKIAVVKYFVGFEEEEKARQKVRERERKRVSKRAEVEW